MSSFFSSLLPLTNSFLLTSTSTLYCLHLIPYPYSSTLSPSFLPLLSTIPSLSPPSHPIFITPSIFLSPFLLLFPLCKPFPFFSHASLPFLFFLPLISSTTLLHPSTISLSPPTGSQDGGVAKVHPDHRCQSGSGPEAHWCRELDVLRRGPGQ